MEVWDTNAHLKLSVGNAIRGVKVDHLSDDTLTAEKILQPRILPARITFISHATTEALRQAAFPPDEPLIAGEAERLAALGWVIPRAQQILAAPELRTQQTAAALGLQAAVCVELTDMNYGTWRGSEIGAVQASDPEGVAVWLTKVDAAPHGGESITDLIERIGRWLEDQTGSGHILAITHPAVIRAAVLGVTQAPSESFWRVEVSPLSATDLRHNGRYWTLRSVGCSLGKS